MIRALQKKFVVAAMIAVTVLLAVVLGALNIFNAVSNARQTEMLLDELGAFTMRSDFAPLPAENGMTEPPFSQDPSHVAPAPSGQPQSGFGDGRRRGFLDEPMNENTRMSAVYFTVEFSSDGQVRLVDTSHIASISEDDAVSLAQTLSASASTGTTGSYRYKVFTLPDGGMKVIFLDGAVRRSSVLRVALLSLLLGGVSWLLMLAFVILLSKRAIRPIAENMQRQRQFVTDAGHELKTPLAIILANTDAMELRTGESKYSRNIRTQTQRLSDLTKNLLTLARFDEFSVLENAQSFDLSALCSEVFTPFSEPAELRHIQYRLQLQTGLSLVGDRNQISQLCSILGDNAVKYCPEDGVIEVRLEQKARGSGLMVSNTVSEVPDLDRIFDRFYRSDSSRNQKSGGFGIGLSAAQAIAKLHNAMLSASYNEEQAMIIFSVQFPG